MSSGQVVAIVMDGKTYEVDKRKLIEQSDYFRALYGSGMRESTSDCVRLQGLSGAGLELVLRFIDTSEVRVADETPLEDLVEAASFLQVTGILEQLLPAQIRAENCVDLHGLAGVYGARGLSHACLGYMAHHYHALLRRPEFHRLPAALRGQVRETRMAGSATLLAVGDFACHRLPPPAVAAQPDQDTTTAADTSPPSSMLRYGGPGGRWEPLASRHPPPDGPALSEVHGYGWAVLDNYLFIAGGYRVASRVEVSATHRYDPCGNEWSPVVPMNQKRSNFKLLAVQGRLYAVGGQSLGTVESYSPEQDGWTCVSSLPEPLAEFSACECQGMIYVMGGYTQRDRNLDVLRYCPAADAWSVLPSCRVRHVRKQQMLAVEDTIYLLGGYTHQLWGAGLRAGRGAVRCLPLPPSPAQEETLSVQSYDAATGAWRRLKGRGSCSGLNLTCALHDDGGVYVMSRDGDPEPATLLRYDLLADAWEACGRLPAAGHNMLLCTLHLPCWL